MSADLATSLSARAGIALTNNVGKYLGIAVIDGRVNEETCKHILEKVQGRLPGWKSKYASFAGRATLTKSVISSISVCMMQSLEIPKSICTKIDQTNHTFIWGSAPNKKALHMVNWATVCPWRSGFEIYAAI